MVARGEGGGGMGEIDKVNKQTSKQLSVFLLLIFPSSYSETNIYKRKLRRVGVALSGLDLETIACKRRNEELVVF